MCFRILFFLMSSMIFTHLYSYYPQDMVLVEEQNKKNLCFCFIPKNGSTTIRKALNAKKQMKWDAKKYNKNYKKLFAIRNPLYRPISIYKEVLKRRDDFKPLTKIKPCVMTQNAAFYKKREDVKLSFKLFLQMIENNFYDPHITFQYEALSHKNLTLEDMDFIFLFENLSEDIKQFCKRSGIEYTDWDLNKTPDDMKNTLVEYVDKDVEIQKLIRKIWKKDFEFYEQAKKMRTVVNQRY